jgi:hypothetical protein
MAATVLSSVLAHGGRTNRYGEFTVVHMHGCSFITTQMEFTQNQNWARARTSCGNPVRDRTAFTDRFETILGRSGSGVSTRGNRSVLSRIVKAMKASSILLEEWMIPRDLDAGMEMKKRKPPVPVAVVVAVAAPAANDMVPPDAVPAIPK